MCQQGPDISWSHGYVKPSRRQRLHTSILDKIPWKKIEISYDHHYWRYHAVISINISTTMTIVIFVARFVIIIAILFASLPSLNYCQDISVNSKWPLNLTKWRTIALEHHYSPSAAYMRQWTGSSLIRVMACRTFGAKPLHEPILVYCQLDSLVQGSVKFESDFQHFHSGKYIWKCRVPKWRPFCWGRGELDIPSHIITLYISLSYLSPK